MTTANDDSSSDSGSQDDMPPSYGSQEYWNQRFKTESEPFEWLEAPETLDPFLVEALDKFGENRPKLLHIGCGTSMLSYHLRTTVPDPGQIHNLDYSEVAIDLGRAREKRVCNIQDQEEDGSTAVKYMRWDAVDLLDHTSLLRACKPGEYSVVVDKSTSDCIACIDDVKISLPYPIDVPSDNPIDFDLKQTPDPIYTLHILAVHLALITKSGARWISLSYSEDRFPFVDGLYSSRPHIPGFPDTGTLWKLLDKRAVESKNEKVPKRTDGMTITHIPKIFHWVYVLERTNVPLVVRGAHI
ncbi:hypothetical protein FB567DRAFT_513497 [Paraphoma chrysanthemicola]|uniref:Methyltransferase domain-containing protein n=1 Tax=Paraphoma chrysanthemicola TaxID=798071 RepID=A0A8K0RMD6_9PLEO|nr:hypothetical protein FB567DRAFT_513497 [Paraphoma chrysanthemicola]